MNNKLNIHDAHALQSYAKLLGSGHDLLLNIVIKALWRIDGH